MFRTGVSSYQTNGVSHWLESATCPGAQPSWAAEYRATYQQVTQSFRTLPEVRHYIMRELLAGLFVNLVIVLVLVILENSVW